MTATNLCVRSCKALPGTLSPPYLLISRPMCSATRDKMKEYYRWVAIKLSPNIYLTLISAACYAVYLLCLIQSIFQRYKCLHHCVISGFLKFTNIP